MSSRWLDWLRVERGLSQNTLQAYIQDLQALAAFLSQQNLSLYPAEWTLEPLRQFIVDQDEKGYQAATMVRRLACLRGFCRFALKEKWIPQDWSSHLESQKLWQTLPGVISEEEFSKLLCQTEQSPHPLRNRAILELLYGMGLRVSELCQLDLSQIPELADALRIRGKGEKDRYVPWGEYARKAMTLYLKEERPALVAIARSGSFIFLGKRGTPLSRNSTWNILKKLGEDAGLAKEIHPHMLRHSYATRLLENGADIRIIQELLGHADVSTTERYTHVDRKELKENFKQWHPRG